MNLKNVNNYLKRANNPQNNNNNPIINSGISGLVAGFLCTIIVTPVEKIKMLSKLLLSARARNVVKVIKWFKKVFFAERLQGKFGDKEFAKKFWENHIAEVKAHVPADKLLVVTTAPRAPLLITVNKSLGAYP